MRRLLSRLLYLLAALALIGCCSVIVNMIFPQLSPPLVAVTTTLILFMLYMIVETFWPRKYIEEITPEHKEIEERMIDLLVEQITLTQQEEAFEAHSGLMDDKEKQLARIQEAVKSDRVVLYLQPIVSLPKRKVRFYECFAKLRDDEGKSIEPSEFLPIADEAGLLTAIDNLMLIKCLQVVKRRARDNTHVKFFINVAKETLQDESFFRDFVFYLRANSSLIPKIVFQVEAQDIDYLDNASSDNLSLLYKMGVQFSINRLTRLDLDFNKLDRNKVRFLNVHADLLLSEVRDVDKPLNFKRFNQLLETLAMDLIINHVDGDDKLLELLDYKIDYAQGNIFGHPRLGML